MRIASLLLAVLLFAGCDSSDDRTLDADFYVGTWTMISITDGSGDRTGAVRMAVDDLTVSFANGGTFELDVDFNSVLNNGGQADVSQSGLYQAQAQIPSLILTSSGLGAPFQVSAESDNQISLTAPSVIVNALLSGLPFQFEGDATIVIRRQ